MDAPARPCRHPGNPGAIGQPVRGIGLCGAEQYMVGVVLAENIMDKIGIDCDLSTATLAARMRPDGPKPLRRGR